MKKETEIPISNYRIFQFSCKTIGKEEGEENPKDKLKKNALPRQLHYEFNKRILNPKAKQNIILLFAKLTYNFLYIL